MAAMSVEELYERYVKRLSADERLRLVSMAAEQLRRESVKETPGEASLLELEGLGAHLWRGIDAQEYVKELRAVWDHRPCRWMMRCVGCLRSGSTRRSSSTS